VRLAVATANEGKVRELQGALFGSGFEPIAAAALGVEVFPEERGASYEENAAAKAVFTAGATGLASLADDSGLEVAALGGAPGVYSARFGGNLSDAGRIALLLDKLGEAQERRAKFVAVLAVALPSGEVRSFRGECAGEILRSPRGEGGFGYDPVFYSLDLKKSFAEASPVEKGRVSHRARALEAFLTWAKSPEGKEFLRASASSL
jgi:XTP/dITP diphosphohydrolase